MKAIKIPLIDTAIMHYDENYKDVIEFHENFIRVKSKNRRTIDADLSYGVDNIVNVDQEVDILKDVIYGAAVIWNKDHECYEMNVMNAGADIFFLFNNRDFAIDLKSRIINWLNG